MNLKVLKDLSKELARQTSRKFLNVETCGLHTLHNAFWTGCNAVGWEIEDIIGSIHKLLHDAPAQ